MARKIYVLALVVLLLFLTACSSGPSGEVVFCEDYDSDLNPINVSSTFSTGEIFIRLNTKSEFGVQKLKVTLYVIDGSSERIFDSGEYDVSPGWAIFVIPVFFIEPSTYRAEFSTLDGKILGSGEVVIK